MPERPYLTGTVEVAERPTIPAGVYTATLDGIEERDSQYGPRWLWRWLAPDAHPEGGAFELVAWSPPRISSSGIAREMAAALGQSVATGARVDLAAMRGRQARLTVALELDREGTPRNRVVSVAAAPVGSPAPVAAPVASPTQDPDYQRWLAEQRRHAQGGPATVDEREALDAGAPLPESTYP